MHPHAYAPPRLASRHGRRRSLISLTPLIDVVFILLIFFMLASSFLDWRSIELDVPVRAATGGSNAEMLLVEVRNDGVRLQGNPVSLVQLSTRIKDRLSRDSSVRVRLQPAVGVSLQQTVQVLDHLTESGIRDVSMSRATDS